VTSLRKWRGVQIGPLSYPGGLAYDSVGMLYVADFNNHRVLRFPRNCKQGELVAGGKGPGPGPDQLHNPYSVAIERNGSMIVSDLKNHRVLRFTPGQHRAGEVIAGGKGAGSRLDQLNCPRGLGFEADGSLLIADCDNHRIIRVYNDYSKTELAAGGRGPGSSLDRLKCPRNLVIEADGSVLVADGNNNRIVRYRRNAVSCEVVAGSKGMPAGGNRLNCPRGMALEPDGSLLIADSHNHRVLRVHRNALIWKMGPDTKYEQNQEDSQSRVAEVTDTSERGCLAGSDSFCSGPVYNSSKTGSDALKNALYRHSSSF